MIIRGRLDECNATEKSEALIDSRTLKKDQRTYLDVKVIA